MSAWRQKAIDCAPELKMEFEQPGISLYTVFMELLPVTQQAHIDKDNARLQKIYDFAEWCWRQKEEQLWNPAGVSFYEHLGDTEETFAAFTHWVKKEIYADIRELLYQRISNEKLKKLDEYYRYKPSK